MDSILEKFFHDLSESKADFDVDSWLDAASTQVGQYALSTHPPGFSHPDAAATKIKSVKSRTTALIADMPDIADGFVRSRGKPERYQDIDAFGNAAVMGYFGFLMLELTDGKSVLWHIENDTPIARDVLSKCRRPYQELRDGFLKVFRKGQPSVTHERIKQVYFPVDDGYHQLSLLTPSVLITQLRAKIDDKRFSDAAKESRIARKRQVPHVTGHLNFVHITTIKYGGSKPQNISYLNIKRNRGTIYCLQSVPPSIDTKRPRLPKRNFFAGAARYAHVGQLFSHLHDLLDTPVNNMNIRSGRDRIINLIFDRVVQYIWHIRREPAGWSDKPQYTNLDKAYRIILDSQYDGSRKVDDPAVIAFTEQLAQWLVGRIRVTHHDKAFQLGDAETAHIYRLIYQKREALL